MSQEASNSYLELRRAKIERNERVIACLGLSKPSKAHLVISKQEIKIRPEQVEKVGRRRSSRLKTSSSDRQYLSKADAFIMKDVDTEDSVQLIKRKRIKMSTNKVVIQKPVLHMEAKPGTTRATCVDVKRTLYGNFDYPVFLGRRLAHTGKAAVVEHSSLMSGNFPGVSFNKYSGVCSFQNDAIFLWVNIGVPNAQVRNEFFNNGEKITWFGGSRMHEGSPDIKKLICIGQKASKGELPDSCGIVLWVRQSNLKGVFEPYTCLGRLGYHKHEFQIGSPVEFTWKLLDYQFLKNACEYDNRESLFEQIVKRTRDAF